MIKVALNSVGFYVMPILVYIVPACILLFLYQIFIFDKVTKIQERTGQIFLEKFQQTLASITWHKPEVIYLPCEEKGQKWSWKRIFRRRS